MGSFRRVVLSATVSPLALLLAAPALAQTAPIPLSTGTAEPAQEPATEPQADDGAVEDIVVTAQRRTQGIPAAP